MTMAFSFRTHNSSGDSGEGMPLSRTCHCVTKARADRFVGAPKGFRVRTTYYYRALETPKHYVCGRDVIFHIILLLGISKKIYLELFVLECNALFV